MASVKGQPAPKPGSTPTPVPGTGQKSAVDDFFAEYDAPAAAPQDALSAFDAEGESFTEEDVPAEAPGVGAQILDGAGRALDYVGGATRTGLANVAGMAKDVAQGKNPLETPQLVTEEDLANVARGKAPSTEEYLRRLGVGEGGSFKIGDMKITARGAAGFAGDVATDPLTSIAKLFKAAPYLKKLVSLPGKATEAIGEAVYRSGLSKIDQKLASRGVDKLSSVLLENGAPVGGMAKIAQRVDDMSQSIGKIRQGLYDKATELGVTIDTAYPLKRAEAVIDKFSKDPGLAPAMTELRALVKRYKDAGKVSIEEMSAWKTNLYDALPSTAFDGFGKIKGQAKTLKAALAADFRDAIVGAGNKAEKGLGDAINVLNEKWGVLLEAQRPLAKDAAGGLGGGKLGTWIDGALLGSGNGWALAGKKGLEVANTTAVKTAAGKAAMELGKTDMMNRITRQAIAEASRPAVVADETEE